MDIVSLIKGTPLWVWGAFVYVVAVGVYFLQDRTSSLRRLVMAPAVFIAWSLVSIEGHYGLTAYSVGMWLCGLAIGSFFGWIFSVAHPPRIVDKSKAVFILPGSAAFLGILLSFFLLRYIRGAVFSINPSLMQEPRIILLDLVFSGLLVGFLVGRVALYLNVYRKAK